MGDFIPGETYIPVAQQITDHEERDALIRVANSGQYASGRFTKEFEEKLAPWLGRTTSALLVNSGSSANLIAITALGLKPGDEVITAAAAFPTTVNPIIQNGATPVFIDVELSTLNVTPEAVESAITPRTRAVVLAHTLGNPFRADLVSEICKKRGIALIEDCCDALGAKIGDRFVGSFGDYATCSFYPAHHISMGEGGAVMAANGKLRRIAESIRDWGRDCWCDPGQDNTCKKRFCQKFEGLPEGYDHKYVYSRIGYNLKATEMQAAIGLAQLGKVERFIEARRRNRAILWNELWWNRQGIVEPTAGTDPSWFGFPMLVQDRTKFTQYLESKGIGTRMVFSGNLLKQPAYQGIIARVADKLSNTDRIMREAFWIGVHPGLNKNWIQYMIDQIRSYSVPK